MTVPQHAQHLCHELLVACADIVGFTGGAVYLRTDGVLERIQAMGAYSGPKTISSAATGGDVLVEAIRLGRLLSFQQYGVTDAAGEATGDRNGSSTMVAPLLESTAEGIGCIVLYRGLFEPFSDEECGVVTIMTKCAAAALRLAQCQEQLRHEENKFEAVFAGFGDGLCEIDSSYHIVAVNAAYCRAWGVTPEQVLGRCCAHAHAPLSASCRGGEPDGPLTLLESGIEGATVVCERTLPDGELRYLELSVSRMPGAPPRYLEVVRDVSGRVELENQLRHSQKMEALGQLAGGIAHDFNNLLTGIMGNLALAKSEQDREKQAGMLAGAEQASLRAAELVKQLLAFSRKSQILMKPVQLSSVIEEVVAIVRETFTRRIEIAFEKEDRLWEAHADIGQMYQVLLNLCVNARDAVEAMLLQDEQASPRIALVAKNVHLDATQCATRPEARPGRFVCVSVADNGVGMDEATLRRVFEPFFTTKELGRGTGLGLSTVYGIVRQHEGWIEVDSVLGKGSAFAIYLPADFASETPAPNPTPNIAKAMPCGSETILLVDDEEIILNLGRQILERLGYTVILARDGEEGFETYLAHQKTIDLVILDVSMPKLSGFEVLRRLQAVHAQAKVILSSGYAMDPIPNASELANLAGFVSKPYQISQLAQTVRDVLDQT